MSHMRYKGIFHLHSRYSKDARLELSELKDFLRKKRYAFALLTDHFEDFDEDSARRFFEECEALSDDGFVFIPGFEVTYTGKTHVACVGTRDFPVDRSRPIEIIRRYRSLGALAFVTHPNRQPHNIDTQLIEQLDGVEIWNASYDGPVAPNPINWKLLETYRKSKNLFAIGGADFHLSWQRTTPSVFIDAPALTKSAILDRIRSGRYEIKGIASSYSASAPLSSIQKNGWWFLRRMYVLVRKMKRLLRR